MKYPTYPCSSWVPTNYISVDFHYGCTVLLCSQTCDDCLWRLHGFQPFHPEMVDSDWFWINPCGKGLYHRFMVNLVSWLVYCYCFINMDPQVCSHLSGKCLDHHAADDSTIPLTQLAELLVASESLGHCHDSAIWKRLWPCGLLSSMNIDAENGLPI